MASDVSCDHDMVKKGPKKEGQGESKGWHSDDKRKALPTKKKKPSVTILGPTINFLLFSTILFCVLGHLFPTCSLTRRSDRHQIT